MTPTERLYSTAEVARAAGVDRQTVIAWDRRGVLSPTKRVRGERRYTMRDLVAALVVPTARKMGLPPDAIDRMVELIQENDRRKLERAQLVTYKSETPGMMRHAFVDAHETEARKLADELEAAGDVISRATMLEIVEAVLKKIHERYLRDKMAATRSEGL